MFSSFYSSLCSDLDLVTEFLWTSTCWGLHFSLKTTIPLEIDHLMYLSGVLSNPFFRSSLKLGSLKRGLNCFSSSIKAKATVSKTSSIGFIWSKYVSSSFVWLYLTDVHCFNTAQKALTTFEQHSSLRDPALSALTLPNRLSAFAMTALQSTNVCLLIYFAAWTKISIRNSDPHCSANSWIQSDSP